MAKSDCTNILNLIPLYIDNMLSEEENDIVCAHIASCKSCQDEYAFLKSIIEKAGSLPEIEVSKEFHSTLMDKIQAQAKEPTVRKHKFLGWRTYAGLAAAAAVIAVSVASYINLEWNNTSVNPDVFVPSSYPSAEPGETNLDQKDASAELPNENTNDAVQSLAPSSESNKNIDADAAASSSAATPKTEDVQKSNQAADPALNQNETKQESTTSSSAGEQNEANKAAEPSKTEEMEKSSVAAFYAEDSSDSLPQAETENNSAGHTGGGGSSSSYGTSGSGSSGANVPATSALTDRAVRYRVINVTVAGEALDAAKTILSDYTLDQVGYRVEQGADSVLEQLSQLKGYRAEPGADIEVDSDYIVLKSE